MTVNCTLSKKGSEMECRAAGPLHRLPIAPEHLITGILQLSGNAAQKWCFCTPPAAQGSQQTAGKVTVALGYVVPTARAVLSPQVSQIYKMTSKQNWWKEETNISSLKLDFYDTFISIWQLTYANIFFLVQSSLVQINEESRICMM